ncbi:protein ITPRID1 [Dipodomys spectabilis]|uniref:protein ITPRID1 n=1 Tax=Dipodomys spectabilis TaxID=105255 RepID=UPI001C53F7AD|nr:protein ITPRID1 [Dipodomys spectabilis]
MMAEKSQGSDNPQESQEKSKREILRHTKTAWMPLDGQSALGSEEESQMVSVPLLEDFKQENIQQWLDSGFFVSVNEHIQQVIDPTGSLHEEGMVQMTVKEYMRSLHQLSETPSLSRGTSFNSCHSTTSVPQSIPEWLEFWEKDPVDILLDLGFGTDEPDICTQIPARFLTCGSAARGIDMHVFLEAQKQRMDVENPNLYGRFRQLEILDRVTSAFSSLLHDVNVLQSNSAEKAGGQGLQKTSARGAQEPRKRMSRLLRRASRQDTRRICKLEAPEALGIENGFPTSSAKQWDYGAELPMASISHSQDHKSSLTELHSVQICDIRTPYHSPRASLEPSSSVLARQSPLPWVPQMSVRARTQKDWIYTSKPKNSPHLVGKAPDSFEMEEVQSFEEEMSSVLNLTSGTAGARVDRANSCQSDSSGFLEEPLEPPQLQVEGSESRHGPPEAGEGKPRDSSHSSVSFRNFQQESGGSDSMGLVGTSSSQDCNVLEEKTSAFMVEEKPLLGASEGPPDLWTPDMDSKNPTGGEDPEEDVEYEDANPGLWGPLVPEITEKGGGSVRPEEAGEVPGKWQCQDPQRSSGMDSTPIRVLRVDSESSRAMESSKLCSDTSETVLAQERPSQHIPSHGVVTPHTADLVRTTKSSPYLHTLPEADAGCHESVTTPVSSGLESGAWNAVAVGANRRGAAFEQTLSDPITMTGTQVAQVRDVSVQTSISRSPSQPCCLSPWNKLCACGRNALTKSASLDTDFPRACTAGFCHSTPVHCCLCGPYHPYAPGDRCCLSPAPAACSLGLHPQTGLTEAPLMETPKVLQDTTRRELPSCTLHGLEAITTVCQSFREYLEEVGQHLAGQQALLSRDMLEEEREEVQHLHALREALRQQVAELEFQLGDLAGKIREELLLELDCLIGESLGLHTNLPPCNWTEDRNGQNLYAHPHPAVVPEPASPPFSGETQLPAACTPLVLRSSTMPSAQSPAQGRRLKLQKTEGETLKAALKQSTCTDHVDLCVERRRLRRVFQQAEATVYDDSSEDAELPASGSPVVPETAGGRDVQIGEHVTEKKIKWILKSKQRKGQIHFINAEEEESLKQEDGPGKRQLDVHTY